MRQKLFQLFILIVLGSILTTILTWPFLLKLATFYSDIGDYPLNGYILWYNQLSLATGRILNPNQYFNSFQLYPWPYSVAFGEFLFIPSLIFSPIYWISQQLAFSVNFYVFLSFVLSFISSFYCLNYLIKNKYASFIGAIVYTFNPMTYAHFPNHVQLMGKYFLPPLLLYGYLFFKKPETKAALLFFLFFTLNALTSFYLMFFSNFALVVYLLFFFFLNFYRRNYIYFVKILKKSLFFILFIPILTFFYLPILNFAHKEKAAFDIQYLWWYSATLEDWVSPLPNNLLYKNLLKTDRSEKIPGGGDTASEEHTLFLNTIPSILAILGLFFLIKSLRRWDNRENNDRLVLATSCLVLITSGMLAFGPNLAFNSSQSSNIKMPFHYLIQWLPIFKGIRVLSRFQFIFYIPFSILVAYGSLMIFRTKKRSFLPILILLATLLIVENFNHFRFDSTSAILGEKDYIKHNFSFLKGKGTFHSYTLGDTTGILNFGTLTGEKMINGYNGYTPPDAFYFLGSFKIPFEENKLKELYAIGIQYIIIHKDLLTAEQVQNLSLNQVFLQKGTIFEKNEIQVVDLEKFAFNIKLCSFDKDFDFKLGFMPNVNPDIYQLIIENQSGCYLTNTFQDRYRSKVIDKNGVKVTAFIRMPIVIGPFEKISVDEIKRDLEILSH
ncbi:hypothetical protein HY384_04150 [Candidatus Daviesbacteria bacterium]|nr:hypothetical protein [Candidatus Daviesbacteria bacterium]